MKKIIYLVFLLTISALGNAQTSKMIGSWLMTKAETTDGVKEPYFVTDFNSDGTFKVMGMVAGTWKYDAKKHAIELSSKLDKDFNGTGKVEKVSSKELVILKDGVKMFYRKVDMNKIESKNKKFNTGTWKGTTEDGSIVILKFNLPDSLLIVVSDGGMTDRSKCSWMYEPKENHLIVMGFSHLLRGKVDVVKMDDEKLVLAGKNETITLGKESNKPNSIERLTFKEEDFPEETESEPVLPWSADAGEVAYALKDIKMLQFRRGVLQNETNTLIYKEVISKLKVNEEEPRVVFSNFTIDNGDTSQYSQNVKGRLSGSFNRFFPLEEPWPYRVAGEQMVKVPAGSFNCTVIEGIDGEAKIKYWMIIDLPGVYAKTIRESVDPFGKTEYVVKELTKIVK